MENKKEHLVLSFGFFMILLVFFLTLFRADFFVKNEDKQQDSNYLGVKTTSAAKYPTIGAKELQKKTILVANKNNVTLLDVRPFDTFIEERIMDSYNLPLDEFPAGDKIDKNKQVIIIGQGTNDSDVEKAYEKLKEEKFENVVVLAGGFDAWKQQMGTTISYGNPNSFIDQSKVSYIDPEQLKGAIDKQVPVYIVDVRTKSDYDNGHIRGAINIPFDDLEKRRGEISERKVVVVGLNELQEFQSAVQMYDMLLVSPFVMRTAMTGWQSKGFELVK